MFIATATSSASPLTTPGATLVAEGFSVGVRSPRIHVVETNRFVVALAGRIHGWRGHHADTRTAIGSLLEAYDAEGPDAFRSLDGVFALVLWDRPERRIVAARDHVGIEPLYYRLGSDRIDIAHRLDLFDRRNSVDEEFVATFVVERGSCPDRTVWAGILPVPPGSAVSWQDGRLLVQAFWAPESLATQDVTLGEAAPAFRSLLERSVADRIDPAGRTWAHLSGGLDSSSVVTAAGTLIGRNGGVALGGTITLTDSLGNGDESTFADAVTRQQGVANIKIRDEWPWRDDGVPAPLTDEPARDYAFYARDRRLGRLVSAAGGTSLLSGVGPDHLLPTSSAYVADLLWRLRWREAARESRRWAMATRRPVTRVASEAAILLCRPSRQPRRDAGPCDEMLTWFQPAFARRHGLHRRAHERWSAVASRGRLFQSDVLSKIRRLAGWLPAWFSATGVEMRHPFLDVRLVEFCLTLPYRCATDVAWSKPVLRHAMKGALVEEVRQRRTKSMIDPRICWAFAREYRRLSTLLRNPVLGDLGWIEPGKVRAALDGWSCGAGENATYLYSLLSLETWLSMKAGRCPPAGQVSEHAAVSEERSLV